MARILVVDDSRTSRKIISGVLTEAGHEVIAEAVDGLDGVNKYEEFHPDAVTLDITMPNMDGIEALCKIREKDPAAKVIMVTAAGQQNKMLEAIKNGASDFVTKPFEKEDVLDKISKLL